MTSVHSCAHHLINKVHAGLKYMSVCQNVSIYQCQNIISYPQIEYLSTLINTHPINLFNSSVLISILFILLYGYSIKWPFMCQQRSLKKCSNVQVCGILEHQSLFSFAWIKMHTIKIRVYILLQFQL